MTNVEGESPIIPGCCQMNLKRSLKVSHHIPLCEYPRVWDNNYDCSGTAVSSTSPIAPFISFRSPNSSWIFDKYGDHRKVKHSPNSPTQRIIPTVQLSLPRTVAKVTIVPYHVVGALWTKTAVAKWLNRHPPVLSLDRADPYRRHFCYSKRLTVLLV